MSVKRSACATLLLASLCYVVPPPAVAQNDNFADRIPISVVPDTQFGDNLFATSEPNEPDHAGAPALSSVWWSLNVATTQQIEVNTFGSDFDTLLAVYTGTTLSNLVEVASNDQAGGGDQSQVSFSAAAGTDYHIAVDGFFGTQGTIELNVLPSLSMAPPNDDFANAIPLATFPASTTGTTVDATLETGEPIHADALESASVWWTWTAISDGPVRVDTAGSDFDTTLAVYTGSSLISLIRQAANNDASTSRQARVFFEAAAGTTYRIAVAGANAAEGSVQLDIVPGPIPPANDLFANSFLLVGRDITTNFHNVGATPEDGEPDHGGAPASNSVWWTWTAPTTSLFSVGLDAAEFFHSVGVFSGASVGSLTNVAEGGGFPFRFAAAAGTTYHIAVDGQAGGQGFADLVLEILPTVVPVFTDIRITNTTQVTLTWDGTDGELYQVKRYSDLATGGVLATTVLAVASNATVTLSMSASNQVEAFGVELVP